MADVTLTVAPGEVIAIMGPSGSGKSTLLNIIAGRIRPASGDVRFGGEGGAPRISRVFQEPALLPWRTVSENVRLPLELQGVKEGSADRVAHVLELASVAEFGSYLPSELSGGLASRVSIARALVTNPELLLLDEPFGSLDEVTAESVMLHLTEIVERIGATAVMVTHSVDQAVFLADRVVILSPRPSRLADVVAIEHPRPRRRAFFAHDGFSHAVIEVRRRLHAGCA